MRRRSRQRIPSLLLAALTLLTSAAAYVGAMPPGGTASAVAVPLTTLFDASGSQGRPVVHLSLGHDQPITVMVDTGSVGLRVDAHFLATQAGSGIVVTSSPEATTFGLSQNVSTYRGVAARATMTIGGLTTVAPVPFQLVRSITCPTLSPARCEKNALYQDAGFGRGHIDGILGIGLSGPIRGDPATNPLLSLPGPYGRTWSVSMGHSTPFPSGVLTLGAPLPRRSLATFALREGPSHSRGDPIWVDAPTLCWHIGPAPKFCAPTIFDTGSDLMFLGANSLVSLALSHEFGPTVKVVAGNQAVTVRAHPQSPPFYDFASGDDPDASLVEVLPTSSPFVDSGVQAFFAVKVTYDAVHGRLAVSSYG